MKRVLFSIVFLFFLFCCSTLAFAQQAKTTEEPASKEAMMASVSPTPLPEYQLPYPGILPDNTLYPLKALRDRIMSFLVSDPLKKAALDLLQADKRLNAGIYLVNKGKIDLAISTISKGENYFDGAISNIKDAKKQGMEVKDILRKISLSSLKHQQVLKDLSKKASKDEQQQAFLELEKRAMELEKKVDNLMHK